MLLRRKCPASLCALAALLITLTACGGPSRSSVEISDSLPRVTSSSTSTSTSTSTTSTSTTVKVTTTTTIEIDTATRTTTPVTAIADDYHSWPDWPVWHCIGINEQGGYAPEGDGVAWHGQRIGGSASSGYPGGLGIMRAAWDGAREEAGVTTTNGAIASPGEQIRVARVILRRHGWRAWAAATLRKCGLG